MGFNRENLGILKAGSPQEVRLHELAQEYERRCEEFDQRACGGRRNGVAIPMTLEQTAHIGKHAISVFRELMIEVRSLGFSERQFKEAIKDAQRKK